MNINQKRDNTQLISLLILSGGRFSEATTSASSLTALAPFRLLREDECFCGDEGAALVRTLTERAEYSWGRRRHPPRVWAETNRVFCLLREREEDDKTLEEGNFQLSSLKVTCI